jgi:MerR family copper efflux transcriptional regulator
MSERAAQPASTLPVIACSLDGQGQRSRLREWTDLLRQATLREEIPGGLRYSFTASDKLESRIRELAAAEQDCCSFLNLGVIRSGDDVELTVTASPDGQEALGFIFSAYAVGESAW